jgi:hypothetical protein
MAAPVVRFRIDFSEHSIVGPGKVCLLEAVRDSGSLSHACAVIQDWRREYNEERPKKSVGGVTPATMGVRREKAALSSGCKSHPAKMFQPEVVGTVMEVTKWLKPLMQPGTREGQAKRRGVAVTWAPPDGRGGNNQTKPTATAPNPDSSRSITPVLRLTR